MTNDNHNTDPLLDPRDLDQFTGTDHHYYSPAIPKGFVYTDGIKYLAETYEMYWLVSDIALLHLPSAVKRHEDWFYCFILKQIDPHKIELVVTDGNDHVIYRHDYKYVNFVLTGSDDDGNKTTEFKLFAQKGGSNFCLMLPSEY